MPIRQKGYYTWDGELNPPRLKWLPIFTNGIRAIYKKRFSKFLLFVSSFLFLLFLGGILIATTPSLEFLRKPFEQVIKAIQSDALLFEAYFTNSFLKFMMIVMALFAGAEQICNDLKFKSFTLYLSRPLTRLDYIMGKFSITLFYQLIFTLVPGLLLVLFKIIFSGSFDISPRVFLGVIIFPIIIAMFLSSLIIMMSSFSTSSRLIKILFFIGIMMSFPIAEAFYDIFKIPYFKLLSFHQNVEQFGAFVFGTKEGFYTLGFLSGVVMVALTALFTFIVVYRIKRVEV